MSDARSTVPPARSPRRPPPFRPRFTLGLVYLAVFFVLFQFLQVLPDLLDLLGSMEPGPDQQIAAERVMREGSSPLLSLVLSLAATSLGSYYQVLPGMKA
jgi:hypothetical protein